MKERTYGILRRLAGLVLLSIAALLLAIQVPEVQTRIADKALERLLDEMDGKVSVSSLNILGLNAFLLKDVLIIDENPMVTWEGDLASDGVPDSLHNWRRCDTLFYAKSISASFSIEGILVGDGIRLGQVDIRDAVMNLIIEPNELYKNNLSRMFGITKKEDKKKNDKKIFDAKRLKARNIRYTMRSAAKPNNKGSGIDYNDLDVLVTRLDGHNIYFKGGRMYGTCDEMMAIEKCGYVIQSLSGRCAVGEGLTEVWNLRLLDDWSDIKIGKYTMNYTCPADFSEYIHKVRMGVHKMKGRVSAQSINMLSGGALPGNEMLINLLRGDAQGYVDDLEVHRFEFEEIREDGSMGLKGNLIGRVTGIPEIEQMAFDAKLEKGSLETRDVAAFLRNWAKITVPQNIATWAKGERLELEASMLGLLDKAQISCSLGNLNIGELTANAQVYNLLSGGISVKGEAKGQSLMVEKLIPDIPLQSISFDTEAKLSLGADGLYLDIDRLDLAHIHAGEFDLHNIHAAGAYSPKDWVIKLKSKDSNARLSLDAACRMSENGVRRYSLSGNVDKLSILRSDKQTNDRLNLSASIDGAAVLSTNGDKSGELNISKIALNNGIDSLNISSLSAVLSGQKGRAAIELESEYLKARYEGSDSPAKAWKDIKSVTIDEQLPALSKGKQGTKASLKDSYLLSLSLYEPYELISMLQPSLYVSDSSRVNISIDEQGKMNGKILSSRLAYNGNYLKGIEIDLDNYDCLNATIKGEELKFAGIAMMSPSLTAFVRDNGFNLQLHYDNMSGIGGYGELYMDGELYRNPKGELVVRANPLDSYISVEEDLWEFGESEILICGKDINIDNFVVTCADQRLMIDGGISAEHPDTLDIYLDDLKLSVIDEFMVKKLGIAGLATGHARLISPSSKSPEFMIKLGCESVKLGEHSLGDIDLTGRWDEASQQVRAYLSTYLNGKSPLSISAALGIESKRVDADIFMDSFDISFLEAIMPEVFSETSGTLSGHIAMNKDQGGQNFSSTATRLNGITLTPAFTSVRYTIDGPFSVDNNGISLNGISIRDQSGGFGSLAGLLTYDKQIGPLISAGLDFTDLLMMDSQDEGNKSFYGRLKASGQASVEGPLHALQINANVRTSGEGDLFASLNSSLIGGTSDLLTFVQPKKDLDHYETLMQKEAQKKKLLHNDMGIRAQISILPDVTATAEFDNSGNSMASVYGNGNIDLEIRPSKGVFNINGDYIVSGGNAKISAAGIMNKIFSIREGGSVKFGGDIMDSELDLTAVYSLKTSLSTILVDTSAVSSRRNVDCFINVSDKLVNPNISFDIEIPDLDPTSRSKIESALNTEDKLQRQFVSLLLFGSFVPDEFSGIQNNSNILLSNVSEIMAGQISSILQKLDIPLDLGFDYQQSGGGTDIFDVALSTQLFNNRVLINGSFGNRQYKMSGNNSDVVGDVNVAIKVGKQGNFRVNLFSHSADDYTSYLDYSQRSGAGISFQKEYNKWWELFSSWFGGKNKDESSGSAAKKEEIISIKIEQ